MRKIILTAYSEEETLKITGFEWAKPSYGTPYIIYREDGAKSFTSSAVIETCSLIDSGRREFETSFKTANGGFYKVVYV